MRIRNRNFTNSVAQVADNFAVGDDLPNSTAGQALAVNELSGGSADGAGNHIVESLETFAVTSRAFNH